MFSQYKVAGLFKQQGLFSSLPLFSQGNGVQFINGQSFNGIVGFARASNGTFTDSIGDIVEVGVDVPRFTLIYLRA